MFSHVAVRRPSPALTLRTSSRSLQFGIGVVAIQLAVVVIDTDLSIGGVVYALAITALPIGAALALTFSERPGLRGAGAVLAGILGISTGPAVVANVLLGGLSPVVVVGLAGTAAAGGLLAAGGANVLRSLGGWALAGAAGALVLAVQFAILPLTMATFGTHPVRAAASTNVPAGSERVSFATADGVQLAAWYTASRNAAAIVLLHGAGGTKADTVAHGRVLAEQGYGVLALDARGGGESDGRGMLWGWHGNLDIAAAIGFLATLPDFDPDRIGALGLSMGGEQAITAAASDPRLRAVVAEGASARVAGDIGFISGGLEALIQRLFYPLMWGAADLMTEASPPMPLVEAVTRLGDRQLLLISSDDPNDKEAAPLIRAAAPSTVELWEPPQTGHTQGIARYPAEWSARVTGFFDRELAR